MAGEWSFLVSVFVEKGKSGKKSPPKGNSFLL